jgi:hypothetical protein
VLIRFEESITLLNLHNLSHHALSKESGICMYGNRKYMFIRKIGDDKSEIITMNHN